MSSNFNAGQTKGQAQAKTEDWVESAKSTASAAHDKACDAAGKSHGQAQMKKEENAGFLQQTGEQMVNMAQGVVDGAKNALNMNDKK